jgi:uncharacterized protein
MSNSQAIKNIELIQLEISQYPSLAIALSGGIDSITLAVLAGSTKTSSVTMFHAISPAVPPEATERVRSLSKQFQWNLKEIDAGEFNDERYLNNPINRCFYCKESLYAAISAIAKKTDSTILSGTNSDDLLEYRPGLEAALKLNVKHPFAKLDVNKDMIRNIAHEMGLGDLAKLPSSPCLSSRIETGIPIQKNTLGLVHQIERLVDQTLKTSTVRCRIRSSTVVIEFDRSSLYTLLKPENSTLKNDLTKRIEKILEKNHLFKKVSFDLYLTGSAFIGHKNEVN